MKKRLARHYGTLLAILFTAFVFTDSAAAKDKTLVSKPGEYSGYSEKKYDGTQRFSQYVEMRDGVKLAVDIYRPTINGKLTVERLPVIWTHTRYQRATLDSSGNVGFGYYSDDGGKLLDVLPAYRAIAPT